MDKFCGNDIMLWGVGTDFTTILQVIEKVNRMSYTVSNCLQGSSVWNVLSINWNKTTTPFLT